MASLLQSARARAAATLLLITAAVFSARAGNAQPAASTAFDGVYTAAQSARGKAQYLETCERCHKEDLSGDVGEEVPPIVGEKFMSEWSKWTVGDLFEHLTTKMPPKRKDRSGISDATYADILAFLLERNGFPAGEVELVPDIDPLLEIEMSRRE